MTPRWIMQTMVQNFNYIDKNGNSQHAQKPLVIIEARRIAGTNSCDINLVCYTQYDEGSYNFTAPASSIINKKIGTIGCNTRFRVQVDVNFSKNTNGGGYAQAILFDENNNNRGSNRYDGITYPVQPLMQNRDIIWKSGVYTSTDGANGGTYHSQVAIYSLRGTNINY